MPLSSSLQHNPDSKRGDSLHPCSARGILNVLALVVIVTGLLALFAGYPIIAHYTKRPDNTSGFNIGGTNGTGQVPDVSSRYLLVDNDTAPADRSWTNPDGIKHHCVFSDEFNTPGRTFWPGDDPFWTAVDIWYGATGGEQLQRPRDAAASPMLITPPPRRVQTTNGTHRSRSTLQMAICSSRWKIDPRITSTSEVACSNLVR